MKHALQFLLLLAVFTGSTAKAGDADELDPKKFVRGKTVVILGSLKDFHEAKKQAQSISRASKVPFSLHGMVYDKKRGLIVPDNDPDPAFAGYYVHRRYNKADLKDDDALTEYISIERSDAYPGFRRGYYIIVGGIYDSANEAKKAVAMFKPIVKDAYAKNTTIYMGCMH